ncbi:MAG: DUF86 domain-containing protein [Nitrospirae bacterium]|nr:DUF86 domain-containing protein [Nitrospirota bacterium]
MEGSYVCVEAAHSIPQDVQDISPSVEWKKIYLFRNVLAHEYFGINSRLLWDIIQNRLTELGKEIQVLLLERTNPQPR